MHSARLSLQSAGPAAWCGHLGLAGGRTRHLPARLLHTSSRGSLRLLRAAPDSLDSNWHTCSEASATVERCLQLFSSANLDGVIEFLPDSVVDRCLERKRKKLITTPFKDLTFAELLDLSLANDFAVDAYAHRGLILAPPRSARLLSSLKVSDEEFLQRYAVTTASGEEMVITFRMQLEDSLVFVRRVIFNKEWFLRGITGEPALPDLPEQPHPQWGPESVVAAQLQAFQDHDLGSVYRFASPSSQLLSGSYQRFVGMLSNAIYRPLFGHREARVLQSAQMSKDKACVVVAVTSSTSSLVDSSIPRSAVYAWMLRRQDGQQGGDILADCWLVEGLQPFTNNPK